MDEILKNDIVKLGSAFPGGISETIYKMVIYLLYEEYSDRNLAELLSLFTGKTYAQVYNDISGISSYHFADVEIQTIEIKLKKCGLF